MDFFIFSIAVAISLFSIYILSEDDFVFLRKNITLEQMFNISFLTLCAGLLGGRLLSFAQNVNAGLFYPGVSLLGVFLAGSIFIILYGLRSKIPTGRIYDYICFSTVIGVCISLLVRVLVVEGVVQKHVMLVSFTESVAYGVVAGIVLFVFFPKVKSGTLQEGSLGIISLIGVSLISFFMDILSKAQKIFIIIGFEGLASLLVFACALFLLLQQEKLFKRMSKS